MRPCRPPLRLESACDERGELDALVRRHAPYWTILQYARSSAAELKAMSRDAEVGFVPPWFRGDWAYDTPLVDGVTPLLENPRFAEAARALFDAEVVKPRIVYVNLNGPTPLAGEPHVDVPAFRGIDRADYPVWLLHQMGRSGLFGDHQVDIATAVTWLYDGAGGAFEYWPDGPQKPPLGEPAPFGNVAIVGDNDFMFHRVGAIGDGSQRLARNLTLASELRPDADDPRAWEIVDAGEVLVRYPPGTLRVSISWKAEVFADEAARVVRDQHRDDLDLDRVIARFLEDLRDRGTPLARPKDPLEDAEFIAALTETYPLPEIAA